MKVQGRLLGGVVIAAMLAACSTTGGRDDPRQFSSDEAGDMAVEGVVRIDDVDRSTLQEDGRVTYRLSNVSGEDQESLTARVIFYYPPEQGTNIGMPYDTDVTSETTVVLFKGQSGYEFTAESRAFAERAAKGEKILATRLDMEAAELVAMVARDGTSQGTRVLNGRMECVGISPEDLRLGLDGAPPQLWLELENVGRELISNVRIKAVFFDSEGESVVAESGWSDVPELDPGRRGRVDLDISGVGSVRNRPFLVRVSQASGLFGAD